MFQTPKTMKVWRCRPGGVKGDRGVSLSLHRRDAWATKKNFRAE
jgi:hypothetical protein